MHITDPQSVERIARWYVELNSNRWPDDLRRPVSNAWFPLSWWGRAARLFSRWWGQEIQREIELQSALCAISVCRALIGEKEIARGWHKLEIGRTDAEFEEWWASRGSETWGQTRAAKGVPVLRTPTEDCTPSHGWEGA
jgi:hypothetical protein